MPEIIVSDTSCLILLNKIGRLDLLRKLFGNITITQVVADEFGKSIPEFIKIENPADKNYQKILETLLDSGEASTVALALEKKNCLLILDDTKGRREARQLKIDLTGTLGILVIAKEKGFIKSFTNILKEIEKTDFRISEDLIKEAKRKCGE